jgi:hypothetical protein
MGSDEGVKQCGVTMYSVASFGHVHVCTRPFEHKDHMDDPDHYCRGCNRFFYERPDQRRKA